MLGRPSPSAARSLRRACGRNFSTSRACAVRAVFSETENAELNSTLATIQEKIILPAFLPDKQRDRVFNPKMKTQLEQNPIVIEVEGLEHKFSTIDRFRGDVPNSKTILNEALAQMRSPDDWANLGTLLAGYKKAGIRLPPDSWARIVRTAGDRGNVHAVIECAKQADRTGLRLADPEAVVHVLSHINDKIVASGRDPGQTRQALRWAEVVLDLLQRPPHNAGAGASKDNLPLRARLHFSRVVRGLTLFTRASAIQVAQQAQKQAQEQMQEQASASIPASIEQDLILLQDEVDLLLSLWKDRETQDLTQPPDFARLNPLLERAAGPKGKGVKTPRALNATAYMQALAQNIKGMSLARELLGESAHGLAPLEAALGEHLREFVQKTGRESADWAKQYENIVGLAPQW